MQHPNCFTWIPHYNYHYRPYYHPRTSQPLPNRCRRRFNWNWDPYGTGSHIPPKCTNP